MFRFGIRDALMIVLGPLAIGGLLVSFVVRWARKKLYPSNNPSTWACFNEFGTFFLFGAILAIHTVVAWLVNPF